MDPLVQLLKRLTERQVDYVLIGGMAGIVHGSPLVTLDVDVCAPLDETNLRKILDALREVRPRLRMRPDKMPLPDDPERLRGVKNLYLLTDLGEIDFLGDLPGFGSFDDLEKRTVSIDLGGFTCRVIDLDTLIEVKKAAGRDKDRLAVMHLEAIRSRRRMGF